VKHQYISILFFIFSGFLFAQQEETIPVLDEEIIVTASQIPTAFSDAARNIVVLNAEELARLPVQTIQEAAAYIAGVDLQQRGPNGVQSDVSIRGASFEQTLVLIDGVKVSDPQTGHHNMNIPLTLRDIEKIEVLKGPGAKQFGPNALGGVINIITKFGSKKQISLYETFGSNRFYNAGVSVFLPLENVRTRISAQTSGTDGYRENTDFTANTVSLAARGMHGVWGESDFLLGFNEKKFGANSFYSLRFPRQWEHTKTLFIKSGWKYKTEKAWFNIRFNYRRNDDSFLLNRDNPEFYHNQHQTNVAGLEIQSGFYSFMGVTSIAAEYGLESINSNNLGIHQRHKSGLYLEHQIEKERFRLIMGGSFYQVSDWGWKWWPGIDGRFNITRQIFVFGSVGRAFRIPSFTELFYEDPVNKGSAALKEEQAWNYEAGFGWFPQGFRANISFFQRDSRRLIDWIWQEREQFWQVQNLPEMKTRGIESSLVFWPDVFYIKQLAFNHTWLNSVKDLRGRISKYALSYLRHKISITLNHKIFLAGGEASWKFRWEDRLLYGNHFTTDLRLSWKLKKVCLNLDVTNMWNAAYEDFFHIPLPGRWIKAGIQGTIL